MDYHRSLGWAFPEAGYPEGHLDRVSRAEDAIDRPAEIQGDDLAGEDSRCAIQRFAGRSRRRAGAGQDCVDVQK